MKIKLKQMKPFQKLKEFIMENKYILALVLILFIGCFIRIIYIEVLPYGINADEASAGYEAYSIANYGIDRYGNKNPVQFVAWGSGQNVLYSYIMIPFVKIFGLNEFSVRIPMALVGCISLAVIYLLLKNNVNKKIALVGTFFLAICPWHIMKSRWGLESNLFPDLILWATFFMIKGLKDKKKLWYYIGCMICAISAYSYGTSYFFLPMFVIPLLIYLYVKKHICLKEVFISIGIIGIITLPMILFVLINKFDLQQINLPFMTIPKLTANRYEETLSIFMSDFIHVGMTNFINSMKIFIWQIKDLSWNMIGFYGVTYACSLPFAIIGLVNSFRKKSETKNINGIFNIWFIASFLLLFVCEPNVNRNNIFIFPMIYYTILGLYYFSMKLKEEFIAIVMMYIILFASFLVIYPKNNFEFEDSLKQPLEYVETLNKQHVLSQIK